MDDLTLPKSALPDFSRLIGLQESQLRDLVGLMESKEAVPPHDDSFVESIAERLGTTIDEARSIHLVTDFLIETIHDGYPAVRALEDIHRLFRQYAGQADATVYLDKLGRHRELLLKLISPSPEREKARKIDQLTEGALPRASRFRTVCELRPVFMRDEGSEQERIIGLVPLIQLEIKTGEDQAQSFFLTPQKLGELKSAIERAELKLNLIRRQYGEQLISRHSSAGAAEGIST